MLKERTNRAERITTYGQFNKATDAKAGIVRNQCQNGDSLSEFVCFRDKKIGLQRHFNFNGAVGYLIVDEHGDWIESVFFDCTGKLSSEDVPHGGLLTNIIRTLTN